MANVGKKVVKRRREKKNIPEGQVHIRATFNNTIVTITDVQGNKANLTLERDADVIRALDANGQVVAQYEVK